MRYLHIFAALAVALAGPVWAINKCTGPDGRPVFQDAPCTAGKGEALNVRPASGHGATTTAADAQYATEKIKRDNEISEAIRLNRPLVGMTMAQLNQAMGAPTKINASNVDGVAHDQLIYERPNETWYVYPRNGIVGTVQHRPGAPLGTSAREARACPSAHEIRNLETSASSITLSEAQRAGLMRQIRDAKNCGAGG